MTEAVRPGTDPSDPTKVGLSRDCRPEPKPHSRVRGPIWETPRRRLDSKSWTNHVAWRSGIRILYSCPVARTSQTRGSKREISKIRTADKCHTHTSFLVATCNITVAAATTTTAPMLLCTTRLVPDDCDHDDGEKKAITTTAEKAKRTKNGEQEQEQQEEEEDRRMRTTTNVGSSPWSFDHHYREHQKHIHDPR